MENKNNIIDNENHNTEIEEESGVLVLGEDDSEEETETAKSATYMPRFTEASEKYRRKGDAKIRERLGIKSVPEKEVEENPDEIKLDPTAEFDADYEGTAEAKEPENVAIDESDESISVMKFKSPEDELEEEAEREREEIKKLLATDAKPAEEPIPEPEEESLPEEEEPEVEEPVEEVKEYTIPDPDEQEFEVFDFDKRSTQEKKAPAPQPAPTVKESGKKGRDKEFNNPTQRDQIKDRFLDSLISIKIRTWASAVFALVMLVLEILGATNVISSRLFESSDIFTLGLIDFLLATCILFMIIPEMFVAVKNLIKKKLTPDFLPLPLYVILGLYTLTVCLTGADSYILFGLLFAVACIPTMLASLYRTKADFIAFKKISIPEEKQVIDIVNTRELDVENKALDGVIDEYKSKLSRTFSASFISGFFKNSGSVYSSPKHIGLIYGVPGGVALVSGIIAFFLSWNIVTAMEVLCFVLLIGCPVLAIIASKMSYFYAQRAALLADSTAIGEDAYDKFSAVDVFAFDDTDIFGQDDVNLKRFMLYGDRGNMDKVMRQMCALFAAVGGPLDGMFSEIIDNRVRHKTATNVIIEDDGICGDVAGHQICVGSEDYMNRNGIAIPSAAVGRDTGVSFDTIKVMYAAEDGEVNAKFYIRYSFSEEFTMMISSLRDSGIIPLVYTRDPNISTELLATLTAGTANMRVVKLYGTVEEQMVESRADAKMITYGDRLDAASMVILAKKSNKLSMHVKFTELCAMGSGVVMAIVLSILGLGEFTPIVACLWQIASCAILKAITKSVFLKEEKKKDED